MRSLLSSLSYTFFLFPSLYAPRTQNAFFLFCAPFGRRSHASKTHRHARQDSPPFADRFFVSVPGIDVTATLLDWRLQLSGPRSHWPRPACDACDRLLYVSAHSSAQCGQQAEAPQAVFAHWRSAEAWYRDDPSVTRLPRGKPVYVSIARTSPRRDVTVVPLVSLYCPPVAMC
jgi:hypothetical protein